MERATHLAAAPLRAGLLLACPQPALLGLLAQSLSQLRDVAAKWEAQAQAGLAQNERLKDLLEESAAWPLPGAGAGTAPQPPAGSPQQAGQAGDGSSEPSSGKDGAADAAGEAAGGEEGSGEAAAAAAAGGDVQRLAALCARFERELLEERARAARLDLQVRWVQRL